MFVMVSAYVVGVLCGVYFVFLMVSIKCGMWTFHDRFSTFFLKQYSKLFFTCLWCVQITSDVGGVSTYGVCFADTSIGTFYVSRFTFTNTISLVDNSSSDYCVILNKTSVLQCVYLGILLLACTQSTKSVSFHIWMNLNFNIDKF